MPLHALASRRRRTLSLRSGGTLTAADDKDFVTIPWMKARFIAVIFAVRDNGSSSGSTTFTLERHRAGSATDLLTAAAAIAHDSTVNHVRSTAIVEAAKVLQQGDQVGLNIDAIPGSASSGASSILIFHVIED